MNPRLAVWNFVGVLALGSLCVIQWWSAYQQEEERQALAGERDQLAVRLEECGTARSTAEGEARRLAEAYGAMKRERADTLAASQQVEAELGRERARSQGLVAREAEQEAVLRELREQLRVRDERLAEMDRLLAEARRRLEEAAARLRNEGR